MDVSENRHGLFIMQCLGDMARNRIGIAYNGLSRWSLDFEVEVGGIGEEGLKREEVIVGS